jgi:hypothetical protein
VTQPIISEGELSHNLGSEEFLKKKAAHKEPPSYLLTKFDLECELKLYS